MGIEPLALFSQVKLLSHLLPNQEGLQTLKFMEGDMKRDMDVDMKGDMEGELSKELV